MHIIKFFYVTILNCKKLEIKAFEKKAFKVIMTKKLILKIFHRNYEKLLLKAF